MEKIYFNEAINFQNMRIAQLEKSIKKRASSRAQYQKSDEEKAVDLGKVRTMINKVRKKLEDLSDFSEEYGVKFNAVWLVIK